MEYQQNLALNWKLKISTRKEIFPPLSLPFLLEQIEFLPRGARLIDEIRSGSSRNSFSRPIFLRLHFFFFSTRGENCRYKNRYSIRERGWKKNGSLAGSCLLSRFMNFQATIIRPLKGGENNDLLFFLSLSFSLREKRLEKRSAQLRGLESGRRGDLSFLWSFPLFEKDLLMKIETW